MAVSLTVRERQEKRIAGMAAVRKPYEPDWEEIARLALPSRSDLLSKGKRNRRANVNSHDTSGRLAGRKLVNGMSVGLSSSARPWFKLVTSDRDKMEFQPVKEWLAAVETSIYALFASTNYYDTAKISYSELGHMGIGATLALEHKDYKAVWHPLTVGSYWIGVDDGLRVSQMVRKTYPTVDQLVTSVRDFTKLTPQVKNAYDRGDVQTIVPCTHVIERNGEFSGEGLSVTDKPWRSIKWEDGQNDKKILLSVSGFDSKPFTAPRWETLGVDDVYCSSSPGFDALPDLRELQLAARRKGRAMDNLVKPALKAPSGLARTGLSLDPGTVNYVDAVSNDMVGPLIQPNYQAIPTIRDDIQALAQRVEELFYADLFMAISEMEGVQPRNEQELLYRNEEKLTQLGPVVDRVNIEKLEVDIDRAFTILKNLGLLPPLPPELEGEPITVDFVSILAQAQKAAANTAIERAARFVGFVAGLFPGAAIKFDAEQAIDEFAQNAGTNPRIIRSDEIVAQMKQAMVAEQQRQQALEAAPAAVQGAQAAELLSKTKVGPDQQSALDMMVNQ